MNSDRLVLVCQSKTCLKDGARAVLAAFEQQAPAHVTIQASGCTGECGNGPIVIVLPDEIWYCRVQPKVVPLIVRQHLREGQPLIAQLYAKYHPVEELPDSQCPSPKPWLLWISSLGLLIGIGLLVWIFYRSS